MTPPDDQPVRKRDSADAEAHAEWISAARREASRCHSQSARPAASGAAGTRSLMDALSAALPGYELGDLVQRGGQGIVIRGLQRGTSRQVAIKVMREGLVASAQHRARFEREVLILARLKHPNIVTILDSGSAAGHFYYIMDYIAGPALDRFVLERKLAVREIVALFAKICDAMNAAHLRGVIHRDLKPGNIRVDLSGAPHILDFGLAKLDEPSDSGREDLRTLTGQFVGSPPWASPEQVDGRPDRVDVRTDVYSLGVMLYHALTREFPYRVDGHLRDVLENICTAEPVRPGARNPQLDDELDAIVLNCLRKAPEERYQSAGELGRDLQRYLAGEPIAAKRDSSWYVFRKAIRRHRATAALVAMAAILVITVAAGSAVMYRREARLRHEAARQARIAEAVGNFLNRDVLSAARPDALGRDATVEALVARAAAGIEGRFADEPLVEAAIRATLGEVYMELGAWADGLVHAERALALRRAEIGDDAEETLAAMNLVGRLYRRLGRYAEADAVYREMLATGERVLDPEHHLLLKGMNNHAYVLYSLGRHHEAYALNRRVLEVRLRTLGPEHEETLTSMNNDAFYGKATGSLAEAEKAYAQVYAVRRRIFGPEHPDTLMSMHNLAAIRSRLDRLDEARNMLEEHLRIARKVLGPQHSATMESLSVLGEVHRRQGRYADAEAALQEALDIQRALGGADHPQMAWRLDDLARLYVDQRRFDDAEAALLRAREILERTVGAEHSKTAAVNASLAALYVQRGRLDEAEPLLLAAHRDLSKALAPDHPDARRVARELAKLCSARGDTAGAARWSAAATGEAAAPDARP